MERSARLTGGLFHKRRLRTSTSPKGYSKTPQLFCHEPVLLGREMVRWYKEGRFPVDKILSFYDFPEIDKALADTSSGKAIKAVLRISKQ